MPTAIPPRAPGTSDPSGLLLVDRVAARFSEVEHLREILRRLGPLQVRDLVHGPDDVPDALERVDQVLEATVLRVAFLGKQLGFPKGDGERVVDLA